MLDTNVLSELIRPNTGELSPPALQEVEGNIGLSQLPPGIPEPVEAVISRHVGDRK